MKTKYHFTPAIDEAIRDAYFKRGVDRKVSPCPGIKELAQELHWPRWVLRKRARQIGISHTRETPWNEEEVRILERWAHLTDERIRLKLKTAGFTRTGTAIHLKVKRLRIKKNTPYFTSRGLAEAFGVESHAVIRWIRLGYLRAEKRGTDRVEVQGGDLWAIHERSVRRFIMEHPTEFDLRKVDQLWFLDLITQGRIAS